MTITRMLTLGFIGVICLTTFLSNQRTTPTPHVASVGVPERIVEVRCSMPPVPLPQALVPKSLTECQQAVRTYLKAMFANARMVVACREEFVRRGEDAARAIGRQLSTSDAVRSNNRQLLALLPDAERDAETQLKKQNTLVLCKAHLGKAHQMAELQPEFRGVWQGR